MIKRVNRLFGNAGRGIGRLAGSGKKAYFRFFSGAGKKQLPPNTKISSPEEREQAGDESSLTNRATTNISSPASQSARQSVPERSKWSLDDFQVDPVPGKSRFHDFPIDLRVMRGIAQQKYQYCTPIQEKALPAALKDADLIGRAQTGTGKTAVYMIALFDKILRDASPPPPIGRPRALIIAPTRELVIQVVKDGRKIGAFTPVQTAAVYGGTDYRKQEEMLRRQRYDVIAATPGRLLDFLRRKVLRLDHCRTLVIDEADRMLDMGFIPDVRRIISQLPGDSSHQTMLFSATVTDDVRRLAQQWCRDPEYLAAGEEAVDVSKIEQRIYLTTESEKFTVLYNLIKQSPQARVLVFENMKSDASRLAKALMAHGLPCLLLTGDVPQQKRMSRLEGFRSGQSMVLVATDVAGRGIHIDDIDYVVNYSIPYEPESYVHRVGRTGRAGASGIAISFACEKGSFFIPAIEEFIERSLDCTVPEDDLLIPVPEPKKRNDSKRSRRRRPRGSRRRPDKKKIDNGGS